MMTMNEGDIHVNDAYFDLVPRPTAEDRHALKSAIIAEGQLMPIVVNEKGEILDGHTRWEICLELGIEPKFTVKQFADVAEERKFVIMSNLARRHLSKFQKIELAWEIYEHEKKRAALRESSQGGANKKGEHNRYGLPREGLAADIFAKYMGTGHGVIHQIEWLRKNADAEMLRKLRADEISIMRAYDLVRGLRLIPQARKQKPSTPPSKCLQCQGQVVTKESRKCHVHRWYCCKSCKWGI